MAEPVGAASGRSWVDAANRRECPFPLQNLPYGVFSTAADAHPRIGVAIGDVVVDLARLQAEGALPIAGAAGALFAQPDLNAFMRAGPAVWAQVRARLTALLDVGAEASPRRLTEAALVAGAQVRMQLPIAVRGFTDFYSSRHHAENVGALFRDAQNPLPPNWLEMPLAYNGRAASVVVSGTPVTRPRGQRRVSGEPRPVFGASRRLDFEAEAGFIVGVATAPGEALPVERAAAHLFGMVLLNDWSARDIQAWESTPLGPFNGKNFATSISAWVVPLAALSGARVPPPPQDPPPLAYLEERDGFALDVEVEAQLRPQGSATHTTITRTNMRHLYWTMAQQLAHHASNGCALEVGDLMGSGTLSGPTPGSRACLLELTRGGREPLVLADGTKREFLEDGDELCLRAWAQCNGYRIGFGDCTGMILPAAGG